MVLFSVIKENVKLLHKCYPHTGAVQQQKQNKIKT